MSQESTHISNERLAEAQMTYEQVLAPTNAESPQQLGLDGSEYSAAIRDPDVICTMVLDSLGREQPIPQLSPLRTYSWLNTDFYESTYSDVPPENIKHILTLPELAVSHAVREGLHILAEREGVLVFDHSKSDQVATNRVLSLLKEEGIDHGDVVELGTQTYYAGKVHLKRVNYDPNLPILPLHEAFLATVADSEEESARNRAIYADQVEAVQAHKMYNLYDKAFQIINKHPCRQGLEPEEFYDFMVNDTEIAKLMYNVENEQGSQVATVCLLGDNLTKYPWLNPQFYNRLYPEEFNRQQILYFPAIATDPAFQGEHHTEQVVNLIAQMVEAGNNEIVVAFDCCDFNKNVFPLALMLEALINNTPEASIEFKEIGMQTYLGVDLLPESK